MVALSFPLLTFRNWEFQYYTNNRSNSFVQDGVLHIRPTLTSDKIGEENVKNGYRMDIWGSQPSNLCTGFFFVNH